MKLESLDNFRAMTLVPESPKGDTSGVQLLVTVDVDDDCVVMLCLFGWNLGLCHWEETTVVAKESAGEKNQRPPYLPSRTQCLHVCSSAPDFAKSHQVLSLSI